MSKFYVDTSGNYIGAFEGVEPPADSIEVGVSPANAAQVWDGSVWVTTPEQAAEAARQAAKATRDAALSAMTYTFIDGAVMQNRPIDAPNIQTAIALGVDRDWLMADNTKRLTSVVELQDALNAGIMQASIIWQAYIDEVDAL